MGFRNLLQYKLLLAFCILPLHYAWPGTVYDSSIRISEQAGALELFLRGHSLYEVRKYDQAILELTKGLQFKIDDKLAYDILNQRGLSYLAINKHNAALEDFSRAALIFPNDWEAFFHQGEVFFKKEKWDMLVRKMTKVLALGGQLKEVFHIRGLGYLRLHMAEEALADFNKAISLGVKTYEIFFLRGMAFEASKKIEEAKQDYSVALESKPGDLLGLLRRGQVSRCLGDFKEAITDYKSILVREPNNGEARLKLAVSFLESNNLELAQRQIDYFDNNNIEHDFLPIVQSEIFIKLDDIEKALKYIEKTKKVSGSDVKILGNLIQGRIYLIKGVIHLAEESYQKGIQLGKEKLIVGGIKEEILKLKKTEKLRSKSLEVKAKIIKELESAQRFIQPLSKEEFLGCKYF